MEEIKNFFQSEIKEVKSRLDNIIILDERNCEAFAEIEELLENLENLPRERLQHLQVQLDSSWCKIKDLMKNIKNLELHLQTLAQERCEVFTKVISKLESMSHPAEGVNVENVKMISKDNLKLLSDIQREMMNYSQTKQEMLATLNSIQKEKNELAEQYEAVIADLKTATQADLSIIGRTL